MTLRIWIARFRLAQILVAKDPRVRGRGRLILVPVFERGEVLLLTTQSERLEDEQVLPVDERKWDGTQSVDAVRDVADVLVLDVNERDRRVRDRRVDNAAHEIRKLAGRGPDLALRA